ncbi:MAG: virulence RhuM family protein [Cyanobium sp. M30B3]|nr:MAG: virulence RhuM family protein [Cyanobium sp. M30B3]
MSSPGNATQPSDLMLYQTEDGKTRIQCRFEDQSLWLTQAQMADLFQTTPQNITQHIKVIYEEEEHREDSTCKPLLQVRSEGGRQVRRQLSHYTLHAILAVGFRVRRQRAPCLAPHRNWAEIGAGAKMSPRVANHDQP